MACLATFNGSKRVGSLGVVVDPISGDKADLKSIDDAEKSCMHMIAYVYLSIYLSVCLSVCLSIYLSIYLSILLVVWNLEPWIFMTFHILGIIIPTDELIFFRGVETTNQIYVHVYIYIYTYIHTVHV